LKHSIVVFGDLGKKEKRKRREEREFATDLRIFPCFSMNSFIFCYLCCFMNMSS